MCPDRMETVWRPYGDGAESTSFMLPPHRLNRMPCRSGPGCLGAGLALLCSGAWETKRRKQDPLRPTSSWPAPILPDGCPQFLIACPDLLAAAAARMAAYILMIPSLISWTASQPPSTPMTLMPPWPWLPTTSSSSPPRQHPTAPATKAGTRCARSGPRYWRPRPGPGFRRRAIL
jgi:hypothetical protein